jgi:hypothetical protein
MAFDDRPGDFQTIAPILRRFLSSPDFRRMTRSMALAPAMLPLPLLRHETTQADTFRVSVHRDRRGTTGGLSSRRAQPDPR